ncbi:2-iminobutanoate/2-iminopropanoate deaminase [Anseongella ginsenosidimutans]|uniref:2-iminobutanoate/2-iminopropanoate deaminase n=1 Tax=Anseongella ginsenosidimutans TaxID=496056 RepID=A0A4R3KN91_9SPHI|nr:RidA family protein [Anseongella ginsenosidimutans]QEC52001.1 RidA family protein [Anseongella ginsenosidimutans]TCS85701.1 2-iminobutanoate/2-iminopropanoate deaminase [Anseongella ginsenosidimutans]
MQKIINTPSAPAPIGPYNQAVLAGGFLFVSGQIALDPVSGELLKGDAAEEAELVMKNLGAILEAAGLGFENVVKTTIFLKDMNDFAAVNEVYGRHFTGNFPARETVQAAALPKGVQVEISVIAAK